MNSQDQKFEPIWVAGFMSGTSLDAVDAALIQTDGETITDFGPAVERKYLEPERDVLMRATDAARIWNWGQGGPRPDALFREAEEVMTATHLATWKLLKAKCSDQTVGLIGVHGQTVLHRRPTDHSIGNTLQLMNAGELSKLIGLPVAYDFRTDDVAAGGQGAPLAPAYHAALMAGLGEGAMAVLNLGGVANITARMSDGEIIAFDTGPANGPIDEWVEGHERGTHDIGGQFASAGSVHEGLLAGLFEHPWFSERPPKSLDRYDFNASMARGLSFEDGAATLTAFSARAVAAGVSQLPQVPEKLIVCGGGRHNPSLMRELIAALPCAVLTAEQVGWRGDSIEAEAFGVLAARTLRGLPISWPMTTGVSQPMTGGHIAGA